MKTVENRKLKIPGGIEKYSELIMVCMKNPPQGGYDAEEMRKRIKVMDILDKGGDSLEFEDADFECVKQCVKNMRWASIHKGILEFIDYISGL
ncbi:hypothetical protein KAR91_34895 [Candidatus Pacearchaeota archaeon]|nr:hypothetical protein [Candidatus Pacearchaeota archaeon]